MDAKRKIDAKNSASPLKGLQVISKYFSSPSSPNSETTSNRNIDACENSSPAPKSPLSKFSQVVKEKKHQKVGVLNSTQKTWNSYTESNQNDSDFEDPPLKKQKNNNFTASTSNQEDSKPSAKRKLTEDPDFDQSDNDFEDEVEEPVVAKPAPKKQSKTNNRKKKSTKDEDSEDEEQEEYDEGEDEEPPSKAPSGKFEDRYWQGRRAGTIKKRKQKEHEERFSWLVGVKDAKGKRPGDEGYDPTTLYIPPDALSKMTPFERQFWDIKKENFDTVIFFKKGKFYELYEGDAEIGHTKLDLKVTDRVNMKMAGVPESHFIPWASKLIKLGYKIGRVDQLETAIGMQKRQRQGGVKSQKDKLIQRELTKVYTIGTLVDEGLINNSNAPYMLSIKEEHQSRTYGMCLVDASTGEFSLTEFSDDKQRTHLETILVQTKPKEILFEKVCIVICFLNGKNNMSSATISVIKRILYTPLMTPRHTEDFWNSATTVAELNGSEYFKKKPKVLFSDKYDDDMNLSVDDYLRKHMVQNDNETQDDDEPNGVPSGEWAGWPGLITPQGELGNSELVMSALGGVVCYLKELKLDHELLSLKNFKKYDTLQRNTLVIDGQSLVNLEIFENTRDKGTEGTLWKALDQCVTAFGKRLLKKWVCHPLRYIEDIEERLNAIEDLHKLGDKRAPLVSILKQLPDLERVISRIHAGSCRLSEFVHTLECFDLIQNMVKDYLVPYQANFRSKRLGIICTLSGLLPFIEQQIADFKKRFDWEKAKAEGTIVVTKGFEQDYDNVQKQIDKCESELQVYLKEMQKRFNDKSLSYKHLNKTLFQIEIPTETVKKQKGGVMPAEFSLTSQTKTVNRYHTDFIKKAVKTLEVEKDNLEDIRRDMVKRQEQRFDAYYNYWLSIVILLAELDCLIGLSRTVSPADGLSCRPQFVQSEQPFIKVTEMRHPCIKTKLGNDFIPNDLSLGGDQDPNTIILTGPNMGGKSTLLRQTCILVIMAQMGCYVPAESCVLSPVDRIFTRIGANDDIIAGQSTFMVELQETSNIMKNASKHSLVILDELGRGTSTYDGYSIAYAVLDYLVNIKQCRVLFSTHYHKLTQEFEHHKSVGLYHMSCFVDEEQNDVTFLYKLAPGVCPKSYGMNVALMAGIPSYITNRAQEVAKEFETTSSFARYNPDAAPQQKDEPMEEENSNSEGTTVVGELIQYLKSNTSEAQRFGKLLAVWKKEHAQQKEQ